MYKFQSIVVILLLLSFFDLENVAAMFWILTNKAEVVLTTGEHRFKNT